MYLFFFYLCNRFIKISKMKRTKLYTLLFLLCFSSMSFAQDVKPAKPKASRGLTVVEQLQTNEWKPNSSSLPASEDTFFDSNRESNTSLERSIIDYAKRYMGCRYRHGAKGPNQFDCSGFTSYVFSHFGYKLSPSSSTQYTQGSPISLSQVRPGDLLFFGGRAGGRSRVGHVALVIDYNQETKTVRFIHASVSQGIRIDQYPDGGYYSKRYIGARRVL